MRFIQAHIKKDPTGFFTLREAKDMFRRSEYYNNKLQTLKNDLQIRLKVSCEEQKKIQGKKYNYVFMGWSLVEADPFEEESDSDGID